VDDELLRALARLEKQSRTPGAPMQTTADPRPDPAEPAADLTAPFEPSERAALLDAVFARVDGESAHTEVRSIESAPKRGRTAAIVAVAIAIAAALVLWIARPADVGASLPQYTLTELRGGTTGMRSDPGAVDRVVEVSPADRIELVATPATSVAGPVVVHLIAQASNGAARMARVPAEVSASGAVRLEGSLADWLVLEPGRWRLVLAIAPADRAPTSAEAALADPELRRVEWAAQITAAP